MKSARILAHRLAVLAAPLGLVAATMLLDGCSAPAGSAAQPKPGSGIAEYRTLTREANRRVSAAVEALEPLSRSTSPGALSRFDSALHDLELASVKTRARAEAILARGQAYFDEWKVQLAARTDQPATRAESERYARLLGHFDLIRERSSVVRNEFRPFMAGLREFRATLDGSPRAAGAQSTNTSIAALRASGHRVLESLNSVSRSLDGAEAELQATIAAASKESSR